MSTRTQLDLGPLRPFHAAGVLGVPDVHVAAALLRIGGHPLPTATGADADVALGAALCVRALRAGSVCVDLADGGAPWAPEDPAGAIAEEQAPELAEAAAALEWPDPVDWLAAVRDHPLVSVGIDGPGDRPLRLVGSLLYLQRYWLDEQLVRAEMRRRAAPVEVDAEALADGLARLFPQARADDQRLAAATAALRRGTIVAGGPGTGKTFTVARIVALLRQLHGPTLSVALAAPTGKAAARLAEAVSEATAGMAPVDQARVGDLPASTLHRLLGWRPDSTGRFRHDRAAPLPHDVVIVDETSMVSLPLMARLLEAVRPDARLVLVGDPDQLASIEAGAVLGDLVHSPAAASGAVTLRHNYRFGGGIGALAAATRAGDVDAVLAALTGQHEDVTFLDVSSGATTQAHAERTIRAEVTAQHAEVVAAARAGDASAALAALNRGRVLCAHREGPHGVRHWNDLIASWTQHLVERPAPGDPWYVGRPLLVTANDYALELYNGDTGVVIDSAADGAVRAAFARGSEVVLLPPARLDAVETLHAMTIHRGQGSQFDAVTVVLPPEDSPLLTRELLYTAVTRARRSIRVVGTPAAVRAGVQHQVRRASGLRGPDPGGR